MLILDVECYKNYFLVSFKSIEKKTYKHFEMYPNHALSKSGLRSLMNNNLTVGFNSLSYDLHMIAGALKGWSNSTLKKLSDSIIESNEPSWLVCKNYDLNFGTWDHIDLIDVAPGKASLKIYGGRIHVPKIQDLPLAPNSSISPDERATIRDYCQNDLDITETLYYKLRGAVDLRIKMSKQYKADLRSKSDAQIAETIIKNEVEKITNVQVKKPKLEKNHQFKYMDPKIINFQDKNLKDLFKQILDYTFDVNNNGYVVMPEWLENKSIIVAGKPYQIGIGGMHSCEKKRAIEAKDDEVLCDMDVASYYPSIILQQSLYPKSLGSAFLDVYASIVSRRLEAKKKGDKITADVLKISTNGSFGKLASRYSPLYAPELFLQVTMTGQLALLMLIERMERAEIEVVSANTDGVVCHCNKSKEQMMRHVAWDWMLDTTFCLEETYYKGLYSRDVNSYLAIGLDGSIKGKGIFNSPNLMKNPDHEIVFLAVADYLSKGMNIEKTIEACKDIRKFLTVRTVKGGAVWRGEKLGKAIRYYVSSNVSADEYICYDNSGNKVPKSGGCRPLMNLPETFPDDVLIFAYVQGAKKLLKEIGC